MSIIGVETWVWRPAMSDDPMWSIVMFDLPVATKEQRRQASQFRKLLLDSGYAMLQFSVYTRYLPTGTNNHGTINRIKRALPDGGEVRIVHITDRQWATAFRFVAAESVPPEETPQQLAFF